ncbi:Acyltransferase [Ancylostoma duodenale]|uniref:Acyltransferase n=1 Tax=Ancylostoma duodenale TaxID=51022 RepID=A0A0C2H523_9BILA|nr:Acyltransferase [Ancylostoma duodenale]
MLDSSWKKLGTAASLLPADRQNPKNSLVRNKGSSSAQFSFLLNPRDHLEISLDAMHSGLEAIVQDSLSHAFDQAPSNDQTLLRLTPHPDWTRSQKALFYLTLFFRYGFLFPIRLSFLLLSFAFLFGAVVVAVNKRLTDKEKTWVAIVYCRLFCCSMGMVGVYRNKHLRPKGSGSIETLANSLCPTYWVERKSATDRREFLSEIIKKAKYGGPVLLFPEGYCSNNTQVLQFRKAIFDDGIRIYPIAIRQNSRYGDSFWWDEQFHEYLLRVMCSWATYYDVTYLPSMVRLSHETNAEFAARVQATICDVIGVPAGEFDGSFWYSKTEQQRLLGLQRETCATALLTYHTDKERTESDDGYFSVSSAAAGQDDRPTQVN